MVKVPWQWAVMWHAGFTMSFGLMMVSGMQGQPFWAFYYVCLSAYWVVIGKGIIRKWRRFG